MYGGTTLPLNYLEGDSRRYLHYKYSFLVVFFITLLIFSLPLSVTICKGVLYLHGDVVAGKIAHGTLNLHIVGLSLSAASWLTA